MWRRDPRTRCVAGMLTWNDPARCHESLAALLAHVPDLDRVIIYDNGSAIPFTVRLPRSPRRRVVPPVTVIRGATNEGAGRGLSHLMTAVLAARPTSILYVEDDFVCRRPFAIGPLDALLRSDPTIGRIAICERPAHPKAGYYTFALPETDQAAAAAQVDAPFLPVPHLQTYQYQRLRIGWSNYPCLLRPEIAQQYLTHGWTEGQCGARFYAGGWVTLSLYPGMFYQSREGYKIRQVPGWKH